MSITADPVKFPPQLETATLAHEIGVECERALRRLDGLISERDDVLLVHTRTFVRRAERLSQLIARAQTGG